MRAKMLQPSTRHNAIYSLQIGSPSAKGPGGQQREQIAEEDAAMISLRDWFAGQALVGVLSKLTHDEYLGSAHVELADDAYRLADAMLARRSE